MDYINLATRACWFRLFMSYGGPTKQFPWTLSEADSHPFIQQALELDINFFDTANVYNEGNSEKVVGQALRYFTQRDNYVLATKFTAGTRTRPSKKRWKPSKKW